MSLPIYEKSLPINVIPIDELNSRLSLCIADCQVDEKRLHCNVDPVNSIIGCPRLLRYIFVTVLIYILIYIADLARHTECPQLFRLFVLGDCNH
jgi:hypothetical protein